MSLLIEKDLYLLGMLQNEVKHEKKGTEQGPLILFFVEDIFIEWPDTQ